MEKATVVLGAHVFVGIALAAFGVYRATVGQVVPGALNVVVAALVIGAGVFISRWS
ncbi:hypothetical protein [Halobaculum rubrum]|uniref:hypothetical protein n=1 Tax=Halobaculum rubrum TaxID=2872158 RepID=UPI001CA4646A|nr:hypothetical protein [Halobaculum rubrum]QZX99112.1 hypothetical protein K6T25_12740 [Halobaculum rubrum]